VPVDYQQQTLAEAVPKENSILSESNVFYHSFISCYSINSGIQPVRSNKKKRYSHQQLKIIRDSPVRAMIVTQLNIASKDMNFVNRHLNVASKHLTYASRYLASASRHITIKSKHLNVTSKHLTFMNRNMTIQSQHLALASKQLNVTSKILTPESRVLTLASTSLEIPIGTTTFDFFEQEIKIFY
jgi:hypothetical protein